LCEVCHALSHCRIYDPINSYELPNSGTPEKYTYALTGKGLSIANPAATLQSANKHSTERKCTSPILKLEGFAL